MHSDYGLPDPAQPEEGLTVLMVSHDMELVSQYAGRVLVLTGGQLIGDGATHDVMRDQPLLGRAACSAGADSGACTEAGCRSKAAAV